MRRYRYFLLLAALAACDDASPGPRDLPDQLSGDALLEHIGFLAADELFGRRGGSEWERQAADYIRGEFEAYGLEPGALGYLQTFTLPPPAGEEPLSSQNVLGVLPGVGSLAGQWLIVGAHYDHLGWSQVTDDSIVVFNGADDNASGTATLMEVARFASERAAAGVAGASGRRSILFQAFGSEELGLVGSFHFCEQPTLPLDSVVAMLNFDMVGRLRDNTLTLIGSSSSPEWRDLASAANVGALRLTYSDANLERSDQYCFYLHGRPVLFLHTGLHVQYHTPFDDTELINEDGMVRVGALAAELVLELATRPDRLVVGANVAASAAP